MVAVRGIGDIEITLTIDGLQKKGFVILDLRHNIFSKGQTFEVG